MAGTQYVCRVCKKKMARFLDKKHPGGKLTIKETICPECEEKEKKQGKK